MTIGKLHIRKQISLAAMAIFVATWVTLAFDLVSSHNFAERESETETMGHAETFAEFSRSTVKRIDESLLDFRSQWDGNWNEFEAVVKHRQSNISDLSFQVVVIGADGIMAFSSLSGPKDKTDLHEREHFKIHKENPGVDRLFISKPLKGKVSGKWTIQFTRPIYRNSIFSGVQVVSVSPEQFAEYGVKTGARRSDVITIVRDSGEIVARYPMVESALGQVIKRNYLAPDAPQRGTYRERSLVDGIERVYGYYKVPEYGLNFVVGIPESEVFDAFRAHRTNAIALAIIFSFLILVFRFILNRSLLENEVFQRELVVTKDRAEAASLAKTQFLANMSHEIRTPMNGVIGMHALLSNTTLDREQKDYLNKASESARSLLSVINDILDFSKIEAGKMTLESRPFRLDRMLRALAIIASANPNRKNVELLFDIDPSLPRRLIGDEFRLQQVLTNLIGNAIKFTSVGEVVLKIQVNHLNDKECKIDFSVKDSGIGIAPENQQKIFDGFSQADASTTRRFGGTGLGLAISQQIVNLYGSNIQLQSKLGVGSTFSFSVDFPLFQDIESSDTSADEDWVKSTFFADAKNSVAPLRTLVVDDNAIAGELICKVANELKWNAEVVQDGQAALDLMMQRNKENLPFDLFIVDWQMHELDGWEVVKRIRLANSKTNMKPTIVMVSAHADLSSDDRKNDPEFLLDGILIKPFTASMLLETVLTARAESDPSKNPDPASQPVLLANDFKRLASKRVLIVEDNKVNMLIARTLLTKEGAQVTSAENGQIAVDLLSANPLAYDLVLMDMQMPVLDGCSATRVIRQDLGLAALPIIAMTANAMDSDRITCLEAGMNDHIGKPFQVDALVELLIRHSPSRSGFANLSG